MEFLISGQEATNLGFEDLNSAVLLDFCNGFNFELVRPTFCKKYVPVFGYLVRSNVDSTFLL